MTRQLNDLNLNNYNRELKELQESYRKRKVTGLTFSNYCMIFYQRQQSLELEELPNITNEIRAELERN